LNDIVNELPSGDHIVCAGDYSDSVIVDQMGKTLRKLWGRLDALVSCAGIILTAPIIESDIAEWRRPFDLMVNGTINVTRMAVPIMDRGGRIVHVTSIHGERVEQNSSAYAMAKAAMNQYCRALALELADKGILVNAIAPGFIDTPMSVGTDGTNELETEWFRDNYVKGGHLPLRRAGRPEEIAGVAYFLAGPDASYLTGQVITVDGGLTITF
jgi:3-oxoacyl-[acyl-carrier protein] reductase